jgi:transcription elongation factor GreB
VSKAFTRESDEARAEEIPSYRPQLPSGARNYITLEGADRLKRRLNKLLEKKRALAIVSNDAGTASQGQQSLESDIRKLQQILDSVVVAKIPVDQQKVAFGATVMIRHGNGQEEAYQIVGVEEADPERGCISWISPLARVLLSRKTGEKLKFQSPAGSEELTILSVRYPSG